jgi:hypothetical protein
MAVEEKPERIDDVSYYNQIRTRLEHEDGLIVNRLSWLVASQSFLFTAYAIVLNGLATPGGGAIVRQQNGLIHLLPLVGVLSTALIYAGLLAAIQAMGWLLGQFRTRIPDESVLGLPPIHTPGGIRARGLAAPALLPAVFLIVWVYLLVASP